MEFGLCIIVRPEVGMVRDRDLNPVSPRRKSEMPVLSSQGPRYRKAMQEAGFLHKEGSGKSAVHCSTLATV